MKTLLMSDRDALALIAELKSCGFLTADTDIPAGIAKFYIGTGIVFRAVRKGDAGQPWVVRANPHLID